LIKYAECIETLRVWTEPNRKRRLMGSLPTLLERIPAAERQSLLAYASAKAEEMAAGKPREEIVAEITNEKGLGQIEASALLGMAVRPTKRRRVETQTISRMFANVATSTEPRREPTPEM